MVLPDAVLGSNTSPPITVQQGCEETGQLIGIASSPVDEMPLVEIICGKDTFRSAGQDLRLLPADPQDPIVVNDSRGFFTTR